MDIYKTFAQKIKARKNIIISTHLIPDADGIGSQIGLCLALRKLGKNSWCVNEEPLLERYKYLDQKDVVMGLNDFKKINFEPDLLIVVDTNTTTRIGPEMFKFSENKKLEVLYIDHHPCKEEVKIDHCIDTRAAATGQLMGELIKSVGVPFDHIMALPLYTAILIDTSSFRYPTVSANTHRIVSELMDTGVNPPSAYNGIYGTKKLPHMHLLGKILSTSGCNEKQDIAWIVFTQKDLSDFATDIEDTHAFINHLLILDNIKVACMFREEGEKLKISFRSTGIYDVGIIAQKLGGGGHSHSAATISIRKSGQSLDEAIKETIQKIEEIMNSAAV